jgi:hypothetical protein
VEVVERLEKLIFGYLDEDQDGSVVSRESQLANVAQPV